MSHRTIHRAVPIACAFVALALGTAARDALAVLRAVAGGGAPLDALELPAGHALLIGVSKYCAAEPWRSLPRVPEDIRQVARALLEVQGFEGANITILTDQTEFSAEGLPGIRIIRKSSCLPAQEIRDAIRSFLIDPREAADGRAGDLSSARLLLYYAGHGAIDGSEGFLAGGDATSDVRSAEFRKRAIQTREIGTWMRLTRAAHVLAIFDACFAGAVFAEPSGVRSPVPLGTALRLPVRQFITAGGVEVVAAHSTFNRMLVKALRGEDVTANANCDRYMTGSEIGAYLRARVPAEPGERLATPRYGEVDDPGLNQGVFAFRWENRDPSDRPCGAGIEVKLSDPVRPEAGLPFRSCPDCPWMILIPPSKENGCPTTFAIGEREITVAEWRRCETCDQAFATEQTESLPIAGVSFEQARAYVGWLSGQPGAGTYRLPTSTEWTCAARAGAPSEEIEARPRNCRGCSQRATAGPTPSGTFPRNGAGLYDVLGNLWEWTEEVPAVASSGECKDGARHEIRGGSWANGPELARIEAAKTTARCDVRSLAVGLRVVREN